MLDLGFLAIVAVWSAGVGLWALRRFGADLEHPADALGLAIPLGLGALGLATLGLGEVGRLDPAGIRAVLGLGAVFAAWGLIRRVRPRRAEEAPASASAPAELPDRILGALVAAAWLGTLLTALAPVTDGDALCYHLQVPKRFLERGAVFFDPDLHETVYPLLTEMLFADALALRGPVACRLVHWLLGVAFVLNVSALARPVLGRRAWWAGAVALLVPAVNNGMSAPLNDVALAAYGTAALVAWARFRDRPTLRAAALTGVLCGLAMGVKYPALVLSGLIGLGVGPALLARTFLRASGTPLAGSRASRKAVARLVDTWAASDEIEPSARRRRRRLIHALTFAAAAWLVGGAWYARAFWHTGNPVHPFFKGTFGGAGLDEVLGVEKRPLAVTPWDLLTALGPMTLQPDTFDSFAHQFGPVFLLFLPALALERPPRRVLGLAAMGYGFLVICLTQRQSMRFVLAALGPLSVAVAWLADVWWRRGSVPARALLAAMVVVLGFESAIASARARHGLGVLAGLESPEHFLARREPTFRVGRWIAENLPASARIVGQDHRGFYIPRDYTMELAHRRRTRPKLDQGPPEAIVGRLRDEGFTHLLLCPPEPVDAVEFDPTLSDRLAPWLATRPPLFQEDLPDGDGVVRRYAVYDLNQDADRPAVVRSEPSGGLRR